jgi:transposase
MAMTIVDPTRSVTGGVDTHLDVNVAAAVDPIGGLLGVAQFATTSTGHGELLAWLNSFGAVARVGVEGTSSYAAGLARSLRRAGIEVVEVDRPNRQSRRRTGKSDPADAIEAARAGPIGPGPGGGEGQGRQRRGHPGPGRGQALGPRHQGQDHEPDPPPGLHRPRRTA